MPLFVPPTPTRMPGERLKVSLQLERQGLTDVEAQLLAAWYVCVCMSVCVCVCSGEKGGPEVSLQLNMCMCMCLCGFHGVWRRVWGVEEIVGEERC